jgi:3-phenylpropionate/trans-cinnamate dioxygenase ferredoxin subunit
MEFKKIAATSEIPVGTMKIVPLDSTDLLIANVAGSFYCLANKCPHLGGSLGEGVLQGNIVQCPKHGAQFDVTTGKNVGNAKIAFVKLKVKDTVTYPTKVEAGSVWVGL